MASAKDPEYRQLERHRRQVLASDEFPAHGKQKQHDKRDQQNGQSYLGRMLRKNASPNSLHRDCRGRGLGRGLGRGDRLAPRLDHAATITVLRICLRLVWIAVDDIDTRMTTPEPNCSQ
jgi:hypothetical protein